jgi:hypothetical protein
MSSKAEASCPHRMSLAALSALWMLAGLQGCHRGSGADSAGGAQGDFAGASHPAQVLYQFAQESDGKKAKQGAKILLSFNPNGEAYLYATRPNSQVAYRGNWFYSNGQMTLKFASPSFNADAHFALDLNAQGVTLPFQVLTDKPGTSQWIAESMSLFQGIYAAYFAAQHDEQQRRPDADAVKQAFEYAKARIALERSRATARAPTQASGILASLIPDAVAQSLDPCNGEEPTDALMLGLDSFLVSYVCGGSVLVIMPPALGNGQLSGLGRAPLSGDPRVFIDVFPPGNGKDDPASKSVIVFAPFMEYQGPTPSSWQWGNSPIQPISDWANYEGGAITPAPDPARFSILPALRAHGYDTHLLLINEKASVTGLVKALSENPTPGIFLIRSHGGPDGTIATSDHWNLERSPNTKRPSVWPGFWSYLNQLRASGLSDLVDYGRTDPSRPWFTETLRAGVLPGANDDPSVIYGVAGVTPNFWEWVRDTRGADFHRSLFYVGACDTENPPNPNDQYPARAPYLRDAVQAGAYFAWIGRDRGGLIAATMRYVIAAMLRPTHSAEETFNNLQRIAVHRNMIYVEDKLLDGRVGLDEPGWDLRNLNGYGWDGGKLVSYRLAGWLGTEAARAGNSRSDTTAPLGFEQVWWILFAARWSQDSHEGETKILNCYHEVWSTGTMGALKSPQCNAYNAGKLPTADEVGYAMYLLRGAPDPSFSGELVPRLTLDDGAAR